MEKIIDWEYYSSLYDNVKTETDFDKIEKKAESEICSVIGPIRWATITENTFGFEQLRDCVCNVIDRMAEDEKSGRGKGVASVSNDGYSESYTIQTGEQLRSELQSLIRARLSGTGLVGAY